MSKLMRWLFGVDAVEPEPEPIHAVAYPETTVVDLGGKHMGLERPDRLHAVYVGYKSVEAHKVGCQEARERATLLGAPVVAVTREVLDEAGTAVYSHECIR